MTKMELTHFADLNFTAYEITTSCTDKLFLPAYSIMYVLEFFIRIKKLKIQYIKIFWDWIIAFEENPRVFSIL